MLKELAEGGFIDPDPGLNPETGEEARVSRYRLRDNYTRFYLKYIEPRKGIDAKGGVCCRDQAPERDRRRDREGGRGADEASAVADVVLRRRPKFLGPREPLPPPASEVSVCSQKNVSGVKVLPISCDQSQRGLAASDAKKGCGDDDGCAV